MSSGNASEQPLNVLFLADKYLPHAGGSRIIYHNVYTRMAAEHQAAVTVVTKRIPGWREFDAEASTDRFRIIRRFQPLANWKYHQIHNVLFPLAHTGSVVWKSAPDIVHVGDIYPQGLVALALKKAWRIPYVVHCHGEEITQMDHCRTEPVIRNAVYRGAELVLAANEFARENLLRIGVPEARIRKITPGVNAAQFTPGAPPQALVQRHGLQGKRVLLTVGRLVARKGHATVLEALRSLVNEFPNLAYLIVGTGPEEANLRRLTAEWNLERWVQFAGFVTSHDLPDYYRACNVFVLPNFDDRGDQEGFGIVFLEANACGKPVIGARSGGTSESVLDGVTGLLVPPQDPAELASALGALLGDEDRRERLGRQGLRRTQTDFSWESRARLLDGVNREVIARTCGRGERS